MGNGVYEAQGSFFGLSALGAWSAGGGLWPTCFVNAPALLHRTSFDEAMMPFDGSFSMTSWAATSKSPPNPQWHGPPGGHDHDNVQGHRIWDVWDVVHIMTVFLKELFLHQVPHLNMMCRSWSFTILGVQLAALLLFLLGAVSSRRTERRLGPMPARLCGALAAMALCNTVQAAPGECHRLQHGRPPEASDLELWAAGQRTLREQLQDSVDRWIALRPLQHNSGEARPPTYEVTADDPLHALPEEDITSVHVTCWVTSPYFEAEVVDVELPFPTTLPRLRDALKDSCSVMPEWAGDFIPATPQIGRDYASFVAVPSWIRETTKAALLIDCSAIDAGVFAAYLEEPVTRTSVMMALVPGAPDGLQLYAYGSDRPMRSDRTYPTVHGGVIRVVRDGGTPRWSDDLHQRLGAPERWNPQAAMPFPLDKLLKLCLQGLLGASSRRTSLKRPRYDCDKLLDSASKERLRQRLRDFPQPPWQMHPDQHCKQLEDYLRDVLSTDYSLPPRKIGSSYIPEKVWKWREQKLSFKLRTRGRLNLWAALLGRAFNQWKAGVDYGVVWLLHKEGFLYQLAAAAVKYVSGRIRREINIAKNAFLTKVATEGHQGAAKVLQRVKQAGIGGKNAKPTTRPLPLLYHPDDGTAITTRKQRDDVWLLHFGRQEQGTVKPTSCFIREAGELLCHEDATWSWEHLPTYQDIAAVLRTLPRRKASGLDGIPAELLLSDPSEVSRLLHPLCIKAALHQRQPLQWRGGVLFEAFKKSGLQSDITNYRSLFVSSHLAKTFHRVIRNKAQAFCRDEFHSLHLGSKRQSPVGFASLYVLSHLRRCKQMKCSTSVLYLDISAAYYRLVRELATGDIRHDRTVVSLFQHFGLGEDELRELMQAIQDGGLLSQAGMPDPLRHVVRDLHLHTWFVSRFADGSHVCDSRAGSRPGESWADLLYAHIYSLVLHKVHEHVVAEDLGSELRVDMECGIFGSPAEGTPIVATDATWADDSAFPTSDSCPARLLAKTQRMTSLVLGFCANLGMAPNLKLGKTNLMIVLCGRGQQAARRKFFQDGLQTLWLPDLQLQVPVVEQYKHLGGFVDSRLSMLPEVRYRLAQAGSAYDSAKLLLLNNPGLQLRTRAALFETIVTPTLFNIGQWVPGGKAWDRLAAGYNKLMRRLLQREVAGHRIFHLPVLLVPWFTGCWRLELVARRARLSLLVSLAKAGPTLLWAMLQEKGCWLAAVQADLQWFAQDAGDKWPGCDRAAWPEWLHLLRDRQPLFKRHLRKRLALEHAKQSLADAGLVCLWHCFRSLEAKRAEPGKTLRWVCHMCGKAFQTRAALSVHFFKVHSRVADYRYYATGTRCSACGTEYWSNGRLNAHLRASSKCTAILRSRGERSEEVPPGFGSLKRRKADIEQFTLAPPRQGEAQAEYAPPAEVWPKHQTLVYRELCEELFELAHDVNLAQLQEVIANVLARHPVYPDEILQVLDYIKGEIKMLHDVDNQEPWSPAQVSMLYEALERSGQEQWSTQPSSPNESKTGFSLRQFSQSLLEYDWDKGLTELRDRHGTPATVSIRVDDRWEAEWRCHLEKVAVSAVVEDLSIILPEAVQGAWVACLHGNSVRVTAPQSFWRHPIARPLLSCRVLTASN